MKTPPGELPKEAFWKVATGKVKAHGKSLPLSMKSLALGMLTDHLSISMIDPILFLIPDFLKYKCNPEQQDKAYSFAILNVVGVIVCIVTIKIHP